MNMEMKLKHKVLLHGEIFLYSPQLSLTAPLLHLEKVVYIYSYIDQNSILIIENQFLHFCDVRIYIRC